MRTLIIVEMPELDADHAHRTIVHKHLSAQAAAAGGRCRPGEVARGPIAEEWLTRRPGQLLRFLVARRRRLLSPDQIAGAPPDFDLHTLEHATRGDAPRLAAGG